MKTIEELWKLLENVELVQVRPVEMEALYKHAFEFDNPIIIEIGSAHGASSIILAEAAKELGGKLMCIDSYPEDYYNQEKFGDYARQAFKTNVLQNYTWWVSHMDMPSDVAIVELRSYFHQNNQQADILFIDGMHSYEAVKSDCENYLPLLKSGGYVGFHDYNNPEFWGVKKAADEFTSGWEVESFWDLRVFRKP